MESNSSLLNIKIKDIDRKDTSIGELMTDKKAAIIVNVASKCGLTDNHYKELVEIYDKYREKGLQIIGVPCNQFGAQEPGTENEVKEFCSTKYNVNFPLTSKADVNGENTHEIYLNLKQNSSFNEGDGKLGDITWNFGKFLINNEGKVINYYGPKTAPSKMVEDIEKALGN
jgi:glutathione peroxidase-family protein